MTPWSLLARRSVVVRRTQDWSRTLGDAYAAWASVLTPVAEPAGLSFRADFGSGEGDYDVVRDDVGYVAVPFDGVTLTKLNATEAEFQRLDVAVVLRRIASASRCTGSVSSLGGHLFRVGYRHCGAAAIVVLAAPAGVVRGHATDTLLVPANHTADAMLVLAPAPAEAEPSYVKELLSRRVAIGALPVAHPWTIDWRLLAERAELRVAVDDPPALFDKEVVVIVDERQERVFVYGVDVPLRAGSQPYRFVSHLADRPNVFVTYGEIANVVLDARGNRTESKIFADVKDEFVRTARAALAARGVHADPKQLIETSNNRARLAVLPGAVVVIRRLSEG